MPPLASERRRLFGYAARGVPYGPDDGTIGGWAALASLPFAAETALGAARAMRQRYPELLSDERYASISIRPSLALTGPPGYRPATSGSTRGSWR